MADEVEDSLQSDLDILEKGSEKTEVGNDLDTNKDDSISKDDSEEIIDEPEEKESEKPESDEVIPEEESIFKRIKAISPDVLKKIPELRKIVATEQQYASVFPTVDDARSAHEALAGFESIRSAAMSGDPLYIIGEIAKENQGAAKKFVDNFLPSLQKQAPALYVEAITPHIKNVIRELQKSSQARGDKNVYLATQWIAQTLFNSPSVPDDEQPNPLIQQEYQKLEEQKKEFTTKQQSSFEGSTYQVGQQQLNDFVLKGLDPEGAIPDRMKNAISQDVVAEITEIVKSDSRYQAQMASLWQAAQRDGFTREASDKIINAFLARVKPLVNPTRQKVMSEYLADKRNKEQIKPGKKFIPNIGQSTSGNNKPIDPKRVNYRETSDEDILSGNIKFKG